MVRADVYGARGEALQMIPGHLPNGIAASCKKGPRKIRKIAQAPSVTGARPRRFPCGQRIRRCLPRKRTVSWLGKSVARRGRYRKKRPGTCQVGRHRFEEAGAARWELRPQVAEAMERLAVSPAERYSASTAARCSSLVTTARRSFSCDSGPSPTTCPTSEVGHHGQECSFDALVKKHGLTGDPALVLLAKIVNGADTDNSLWRQPESAGLNAVAEGFRHLGFRDDHEWNAAEWASGSCQGSERSEGRMNPTIRKSGEGRNGRCRRRRVPLPGDRQRDQRQVRPVGSAGRSRQLRRRDLAAVATGGRSLREDRPFS